MTVSNLSFQLHGFEYSLFYLTERQDAQEISRVAENIQRYYLWVIAGIGIPANILAIIGILSMGRLLPPSVLLLALSITDAITLLLKLIANQVYIHDPHMTRLACRMEFVVIAFSTLANWLLVGIAVDRFLWLRRQRALRNTAMSKGIEKDQDDEEKFNAPEEDEGQNVLGGMARKDGHGFLSLTNTGVFGAVVVTTFVLMALHGAVFFIMRDVNETGRRCVVYEKYVQFWKNGWYWINTGLFFFIPFGIILVLTVICVRWLLIDKREAFRNKQNVSHRKASNGQEPKASIIGNKATSAANNEENDPTAADNKEKQNNEQESASNTKEETNTDELDLSPVCHGGPFELKNQTAFTAMMVLAAAFFLILSLPGCVFYLGYKVKTDPKLQANWLLFEQVQHILVDMSHALNFFIYFIAVKVFRDSLVRVLTCRGRQQGK